jgi:hypothetical protein
MLLELCVHITNLTTTGRSGPHGYLAYLILPADAYARTFTANCNYFAMREQQLLLLPLLKAQCIVVPSVTRGLRGEVSCSCH